MSLTEVEYAPAAAAAVKPNAPPDALPLKPAGTGAAEPWRINSYFVALVHVVGALTLIFHRPTWQTLVLTFATFNLGAVGITMGYHRLWSHRAFTASLPLRVFLAFGGTLAFQASIKWWVLRHRLHHRYTDTEHDPYDSTRGLFFSHIGWIFRRPYYPRMRSIDISDLVADPVVRFQHKHYVALAMICGFVLPTVVASMWGDALGGYLWGGFVARLAIWHCTFMINSIAHWSGDQPYATGVSARGNLILAFFTWGEGYHNFHHEFPKDYRNGVGMWDWDPTKWGIYLFSRLGLASGLCRAPADEIQKALISVEEIQLCDERRRWAFDDPATCQEFGRVAVRKDFGVVLPGEREKVLQEFRGKDALQPFNEGLTFRNNTAARTTAAIAVEG